jgi:hypothetical protein
MVGWSTVSRRVTALASTTIAHAARSGPSVMLLSEPLPWATARRRATGRFAPDSALEQSGFELWVPPACDTPGSHKVRC